MKNNKNLNSGLILCIILIVLPLYFVRNYNNQQMRTNKNTYHLKFKDKIVDAARNSDFIFNKTPILVPYLKAAKQDVRPIRKTPIAQLEEDSKPQKKRKGSDEQFD